MLAPPARGLAQPPTEILDPPLLIMVDLKDALLWQLLFWELHSSVADPMEGGAPHGPKFS